MTATRDDLVNCSHDELVTRVMQLESQLRAQTSTVHADRASTPPTNATTAAKKPRTKKNFDASRYSTHHIALKFAYLGRNYNGFEHHVNNTTPLTTIEEELWRALMKARLIFPTPREARNGHVDEMAEGEQHWEGPVNWTGCNYSKCGRTDRGVSAFGQVVALTVRSNKAPPKRAETLVEPAEPGVEITTEAPEKSCEEEEREFDHVRDEINYPAILNRILPPDIRILGWCPSPTSNFSARFSCKERRYKYFFTQPAFLPVPGTHAQSTFLDINRMQKAAGYLTGAHDFRNFCKVDASKQITSFVRRITHASIDEVSTVDMPSFFSTAGFRGGHATWQDCKVYAFSLHGTAFLWHQVRCIMAVLFLIGQRLEAPELIRDMLDMSHSGDGRPKYEMANETPLVLWDCIFPLQPGDDEGKPYETGEGIEDAVPWLYTSGMTGSSGEKADAGKFDAHWGRNGLMDGLWRQWRGRKMDEILAGALTEKAAMLGMPSTPPNSSGERSTLVFDGGDGARAVGKYVPLLRRERMEPVEVINKRFAEKKGLNGTKPSDTLNDRDIDE